jgi:hypothetical protein
LGEGASGLLQLIAEIGFWIAAIGSATALVMGLIRVVMRRWIPFLYWSPAITFAPLAITAVYAKCLDAPGCSEIIEPLGGMETIAQLTGLADLLMPLAAVFAIFMTFRRKGGAAPFLRPLSLLIGVLAAYSSYLHWSAQAAS